MSKAINWPLSCFDSVRSAAENSITAAIRLGTLYYDNRYWNAGDVVDIRVNHEIIRSGEIIDEMKSCPIRDLTASDLLAFAAGYQSHDGVLRFLQETYPEKHAETPVSPDTVVSLVYYRNRELALTT